MVESACVNPVIHDFIEKSRNTGIQDDEATFKNGKRCCLPPWLDPQSIKVGKDFVSKHFFLVIFTHFLSLILLMSYVPVRTILIKTGKSHTRKLALSRYISTVRHVKLWYESDLSNAESDAVRDVMKIRQVHAGVSKRMKKLSCQTSGIVHPKEIQNSKFQNDNSSCKAKGLIISLRDLNNNDANNNTQQKPAISEYPTDSQLAPITQLDMIVTQYCFMGLLTTFPQKFGISCKEDIEGLQGFTHIWAVVGYLLGIPDEFNLCIGDKSQVKQYILNEILLKDLFNVTEESYKLWDALVSAMSAFVPFLSIHAELLYILDHIMEFKRMKLYDDATFNDKLCYKIKILVLNLCCRSSVVRSAFNLYLRLALYMITVWLGSVKLFICGK